MDPLDVRRTRPAQSNIREPLRETASQTAGPYVHIGCLPSVAGVEGVYPKDLTANRKIDENDTVMINGHVFEGDGEVCKDIMLEFWHADQEGSYKNGIWQRTATDLETGRFSITTVIPGSCQDFQGNTLAPFISIWITARGINLGLLTRMYFPEFAKANATDPHLALVEKSRWQTLVAKAGSKDGNYKFDIHLQGSSETVFFET